VTTFNLPPDAQDPARGQRPRPRIRALDDEATHFEPVHLRSQFLLCLTAGALLAVEVWIFLEIQDSLLRAALTGAVFISMISAGLAGNTFRLRDICTRTGNRRRAGELTPPQAITQLPPVHTIRHRLAVSAGGALVGAAVLALAVGFAVHEGDVGLPAGIAALGVLACSAAAYLCGTYTRPVD